MGGSVGGDGITHSDELIFYVFHSQFSSVVSHTARAHHTLLYHSHSQPATQCIETRTLHTHTHCLSSMQFPLSTSIHTHTHCQIVTNEKENFIAITFLCTNFRSSKMRMFHLFHRPYVFDLWLSVVLGISLNKLWCTHYWLN